MSHAREPQIEQQRAVQHFLGIIGEVPSCFTITTRQLMADELRGEGLFSENSEFQVGRLLRVPTVLAMVYFASKTFYQEKMGPGWLYTPRHLAEFYSPGTLAAILSLTYLYKRMKRIVHPEDWRFIAEPMKRNSEIVTVLGIAYPSVGSAVSLIGSSFLYLAFAAFAAEDRKTYAEYRRHLKMRALLVDTEYEAKAWGCTSLQIAAQLIVGSGFGVKLAGEFFEGFNSAFFSGSSEAFNRFGYVKAWLAALNAPNEKGGFSVKQPPASNEPVSTAGLAEKLMQIAKTGSLHHWLDKCANDIGPDKTPDLLPDPLSSAPT